MNSPPGCWCGPGGPPAAFAGGAAQTAVASGAITPGLSSIPAAEAVKTGVTVAGGPPAMAPTAAVSPGGFFGVSGSSMTMSMTSEFPATRGTRR
jgi:hypothetical protein